MAKTHEELPRWAVLGRQGWSNTGAKRPSFAEEPGPGQESVWDYPRPPKLVADDRVVRVELGGVVIAETSRAARVLETSHPPTFYLPKDDALMQYFSRAGGGSRCEWKGEATYWHVAAGGVAVQGGCWSYERPFGEFQSIAGHLAFYASRFACFVDGARVEPQPGGFYGGWVTPELVGPFKGGPGSTGW